MKKNTFQNFLYLFILIRLFLISEYAYTQKQNSLQLSDSLTKYSFEELYSKLLDPKILNKKIYATAYLNKAKNEKDTLRMAHGYTQILSVQDPDLIITYLDSIIQITKNKNYDDYPSYGYLWKGFLQLNSGLYDKALKNLILAKKSTKSNKNIENLITIQSQIGALKAIWGDKDEAIIHFNDVIKKFNENNLSQDYNGIKSETFKYLSYCHMLNKQYDSAYFYVKKYKNVENISNNLAYQEISAEIELHKKNYTKTIEILQHIKKTDSLNSIINHFNFNYLYGSSLNNLNKKEEAFYYFTKADSIYKSTNDLMPDTRKVKEFFINYYKEKKDLENQLIYIDQLLAVDSLINVNTKTLNKKIKKEYDEPQLLAEKEEIIRELSSKTKNSYLLISLLSSIGFASILTFYFYHKKQKKLKDKFDSYLKKNELKKTKTHKTSKIEDIPTEVIQDIKLKLENFKKNKLFTQNNLTLAKLAKQLNTNSSYLSKSINYFEQKNFSSYISDLRIEYCIKKIKTDTTFRMYSVKAIANEIGFNNAESFSKAFYTKTGKYPSNFIKEIRKK